MNYVAASVAPIITAVMIILIVQLKSQIRYTAELNNSDRRFRFLVEHAPELMLSVSGDGNVQDVSNSCSWMKDLNPFDLLGRPVGELAFPGDRPLLDDAFASAVDSPDPVGLDVRLSTSTEDEEAWVHLTLQRVLNAHHGIKVHVTVYDIDERRRTRQEVTAKEAMQRLILESLNEGVILHGLNVGVLSANRAATETFGVRAGCGPVSAQIEEHVRTFEDDGTPFDLSDTPAMRALRSGQAERGRILQYRFADGSSSWMLVDAVAVGRDPESGDDLVLETCIDITRLKNAEVALAQAQQIERLILDQLEEAVILHDPVNGVVRANRAAQEMTGVREGSEPFERQIRRLFQTFEFDGTPLDAANGPTRRALETGQPQAQMLEHRYPDGTSRWVSTQATVANFLGDADNTSVVVTLTDVTATHNAAAQLAASEERLRLVVENSRELITVIDPDGTIRFASPSSIDILGYDSETVVGRLIREFIHHEDLAEMVDQVAVQQVEHEVTHRVWHADGSIRWLEALARIIRNPDGTPHSILLSSRDITDRLAIDAQLQRERSFLETTLDSVHAGVVALDGLGRVVEVNRAFCSLFGIEATAGTYIGSLASHCSLTRLDGTTFDIARESLLADADGVFDAQVRLELAGTPTKDLFVSVRPIGSFETDGAATVLTFHDVSELRAAEADLRRLATTDALTGLPNRRFLVHHLTAALDRNRRTPDQIAVLFVDLDGFKQANDEFGHEAGDELLTASARRLEAVIRPGDLAARYGGDEFVVVVENLDDPADAQQMADRIEAELSRPFQLVVGAATIGGSVGVARVLGIETGDSMLASADRAMYERKRQRKAERAALVTLATSER